jgi:ABC-type transporter MlaC component
MNLRICSSGAILIAFALMPALRGFATADPMTETKTAVNQIVALLKDDALKSKPVIMRQRLEDAVAEHFDFATIARAELGAHWNALSDKQRRDFVSCSHIGSRCRTPNVRRGISFILSFS